MSHKFWPGYDIIAVNGGAGSQKRKEMQMCTYTILLMCGCCKQA